MTNRESESREVKETIKEILGQKGMTYSDLACALGLSLCTVKRNLNQEELSLSRFCAMAQALGLTSSELMQITELRRKRAPRHLPLELEDFFVNRTHHWGYLNLLCSGMSPGAIARKTGISQASTRRYLRDLEEGGYIRVHPGHRVTLVHRCGDEWNPDGPLVKKWFSTLLEEAFLFLRRFVEEGFGRQKEPGRPRGLVSLRYSTMRPGTFDELHKEMGDLLERYDRRAELESKVDAEEKLEHVLVGGILARDGEVEKIMNRRFGVVELEE